MYGSESGGIFGYSHLTGGYPGGQAEYIAVPFADINTLKVPEALSDDQALFLSDIVSTGGITGVTCSLGELLRAWRWHSPPGSCGHPRASPMLRKERV